MARNTFYPHGRQLSVNRMGDPEDRQRLAALGRRGRIPCPGAGCTGYEKGWTIECNMADPADANVARYIREGNTKRKYTEALLLDGVVQFHFLAEQPCFGHKGTNWQDDPTYIVGQRKASLDEWDYRWQEGGQALVAAATRLRDMEGES